MAVEVTIPEVGESITEGFLAEWSKADGDVVAAEEPLLVLETDKITMTVNAEVGGQLHIAVAEGETVQVGQVVATIDTEVAPEARPVTSEEPVGEPPPRPEPPPKRAAQPASPPPPAAPPLSPPAGAPQTEAKLETVKGLSPAVQRMVLEHHLDPSLIEASGKDGRLTKADVQRHLEAAHDAGKDVETPSAPPAPEPSAPSPAAPLEAPLVTERHTREPMSRLRQRIAERLVEVQQQAALLTTFNEADMSRVMALRAQYKESFKERYGITLGFMSFFVKASIDALRTVPAVNGYIDGDQVVTNHYYDIGIAVSTDHGLVVPVVRNADQLSMAEIEEQIADYARRAQERMLELSELTGAVFTISNGGIFGSMLSTPIINPPGSAILGMHAIKKRPVVVDDEIVIRPMMYLAVSYDHRLIDGREAVTFLKRIVEVIENPERVLLEI
jgi:2-oxoglutarate dehydrogenase E2 component (dihydrolipoamide succinyltransferase)